MKNLRYYGNQSLMGMPSCPRLDIAPLAFFLFVFLLVLPSLSAGQSGDQLKEKLFLKQSLDHGSAYVGEQVVNTIELYSATRFLQPQISDLNVDGAWVETLGEEQHTAKVVKGVEFNVTQLRRALFPTRSGALSIPPREVQGKVLTRSRGSLPFGMRDPFGDDFFSGFFESNSYRDVVIRSEGLSLEVKPLPAPPPNFPMLGLSAPIVGETIISARYDDTPIQLGQSKTVEVRVESTGNLNPLQSLGLTPTSQYRLYEESPKAKNTEQGGILFSSRTIKFSIVPTEAGSLTIPPIELGYFDPQHGYQVVRTHPIAFLVEGSPHSSPTAGMPSAEQRPQNPQSPQPRPSQVSTLMPYQMPTWWEVLFERISPSTILLGFVVTILVALLGVMILNDRARSKADRDLLRRISRAQTVADLTNVLRIGIGLTIGRDLGSATADDMRALVRDLIHDQVGLYDALDSIDECNAQLYGGGAESVETISSLRSKVEKTIRILRSVKPQS